ncbi:hypothetical protein [Aurantiacibacter rhizosphaerae]|uniref:Uncharacterized protein n=1 Tax=Aurantiacibacter rhizosphaerae TaxID=2691582 RepID=A0A844XED8_9SPHN|nr:hypothetical protein [Aurantiacibacter rhizosphaerae]MWV27964.1 hypothetical protein [Aurantiacibacter rhizosphaerae]
MTVLSIILIAITFLASILAFAIALAVWLAGDAPHDDTGKVTRGLISRMRLWFTMKPPKLTYRRDQNGRFRKTRRG